MTFSRYLFILLVFQLVTFNNIFAEKEKKLEVGIEEQLGEIIPLDLKFTNSTGDVLSLKQIIDKPVILSFVYYHCPGICTPLLNGLTEAVDYIDLKPGKDFKVITISFDHTETTETAAKWKNSYLEGINRKDLNPKDWYFMTGDSISIRRLTESIGFHFKSDGKKDYMHAGAIYVLAKNGKIARYLFGTDFLTADLKMAILEAKKEISRPTINKILAMCYSYDPVGREYKLSFTRVIGSLMVLGSAVFLAVLIFKKKGNKNNKESET